MGRYRPLALVLACALLAAPARASIDEVTRTGDAAREVLRVAALARGVPLEVLDVAPAAVGDGGLRAALTTYFATAVGVPLPAEELNAIEVRLAELPGTARDALARILTAMSEARLLRDAAVTGIAAEDLALAQRVGLGGAADPAEVARAAAVVTRIDMASMLRGAALLVATTEAAIPGLRGVGLSEAECFPYGSFCIGTTGDDVWTEDAQLIIDGGGNDTYLNNAGGVLSSHAAAATGGCVLGGGVTGKARPNLDCTPAPSQVCTYDVANRATGRDDLPVVNLPGHVDPADGGAGDDGSCGSDERRDRVVGATTGLPEDPDARGVAMLLDLDGSDTYTVPWTHEDPLFGLIEACYPGEPDRVNTNRDLFQGSALTGISLLWDLGSGDDRYRGRLNAQGSGHVGGVGMLLTSGEGDTHFWADRLSQGNGIAGGVGALVNTKAGHHTYLLDAPLVYQNEFAPGGRRCAQEGRAGQGQGGFGGVGVLWTDASGSQALYRAVTHLTSDTYPFAPVLDGESQPILVGGGDAQGSGESFPVIDTPGGLVVGAGLLFDRTDGDASVCPARADGAASAGMITGSSTSTGIDVSTAGVVAPCGTFNMPAELDPFASLGDALQRLAGGAVGVRVVAP